MREEYMAGVTEFERYIPTFFSNRVRIEKMSHTNALEAIKEPCKVFNISLEEGFAESLLEKLSPESADVELTYLQVFLDKIFHLAQGEKDQKSLSFTLPLLEKAGNVSDLLGSFLEEQIKELDEPDTGLTILKSFVSVKGTKKQLTQEEIIESSRSLGKDIPVTVVSELLQKFVNLRILRDKDENGKYELRHDSLATKIYEKITIVEKELMEIYQFLENAYSAFEKRKVLLNANDLRYIAPYEDRLFVKRETGNLIELSKNELNKIKKRIKRIAVSGLVAILIFSIGVIFSVYRFPLSSQLRSLGLIVYVVWFLPVFAYYIFRTKDNRTMNLLFLIFTLLFVGTTFIYIRSTSARLWRLYSNPLIQNDKEISEVTKRYTIKTDSIYNNMIKNSEGHADKSGEYILTVTGVKEKTLELVNYIQDLKISILTMSEGEDTPSKEGREINFAKINHMDEANVPSQVMVGANYNGKAFALNELVQRYKVYINNTVKNEPALAEGIDITLDLNDKIIKDSDKDSSYLQPWEQYYFQGKGMGIVLNTLSQLQSDIKYCESEVITYLYTKMSTEIYLDSSKKH
jgi:hypothetical protein